MARTKNPQLRTQIFSSALMTLMERNNVNQVQLGASTGIAVSRINNYLHGKYRTIRPDHLERIIKTACRSVDERNELIRSYLLDLLPEALHSDVQIDASGNKSKTARSVKPQKSLLPSTTASALASMQTLSLRSARARSRVELFAEILADIGPA